MDFLQHFDGREGIFPTHYTVLERVNCQLQILAAAIIPGTVEVESAVWRLSSARI